jgi:hypothetical protein
VEHLELGNQFVSLAIGCRDSGTAERRVVVSPIGGSIDGLRELPVRPVVQAKRLVAVSRVPIDEDNIPRGIRGESGRRQK